MAPAGQAPGLDAGLMRRAVLRAGALALLLLLAACTGTVPDRQAVLLFVTHGDADGRHVAALVADRDWEPDRFTYLEDTEALLPGTPLALDVLDRADGRSGVVLLLQDDDRFRLARFDTRQLDADAPVPLSPQVSDLTAALVDGSDGSLTEDAVCPVDVQAGADGDVLAFMNVPAECNAENTEAPSILLLDAAGETRMLAGSTSLLTGSGLFIRQQDDPEWPADTLFHLEEAGGRVELLRTELPDGESAHAGYFSSGSDNPAPVALGMGTGKFLALQPDRLNLLDDERVSTRADADGVTDLRQLVQDDYTDELDTVIALGSRSVLLFGEGGGKPVPVQLASAVSTAALNTDGRWVYLAGSGTLGAVDLLVISDGSSSSAGRLRRIPELGSPSLLTWFRSEPPPSGGS